MLKILKILRRACQNNCFIIVHAAITQLAQDNTGTSPEVLLKVLTSGTYKEPSRNFQGTNIKIYDLWFIYKIVL